MTRRWPVSVVVLAAAGAFVFPAVAAEPRPTMTLTTVTVKRSTVRDGYRQLSAPVWFSLRL